MAALDRFPVVPEVELGEESRELAEMVAARRDLVAATARQIDAYVEHHGLSAREAAAKARATGPIDPADLVPEQVGWREVASALEADPERGQALWQAIKADAARELATGFRAGRSLEPGDGSPHGRARYKAIVDWLEAALEPRNGLEHLLVQQMASAHELHLRWTARAVQRAELDAWHGDQDRKRELARMSPAQRERYEAYEGWAPPRLSDAEALDQAVLIADRYQRSFLRLLKAFRDTRRVIGAVVVGEGGTLNVAAGPQQVNVVPAPAVRQRKARAKMPARLHTADSTPRE